jgi:RNA polymerase sigma-70 factor, ECF subfamily
MADNLIPFRRPPPPESTDEDLVSASASGDSGALEALFGRHGARVHRTLARLRCVDRGDLEDLVQATFVEVQRSARRFDGRSGVPTWIVGIAMNLVRHYVRGEKRRRVAMSVLASVSPPPEGKRPDERAAQRELIARLQAAFDELPVELRIVFTLCDLEGMRGVDVARALALPEGTVWRRLHEARLFLRGELGEDEVAR